MLQNQRYILQSTEILQAAGKRKKKLTPDRAGKGKKNTVAKQQQPLKEKEKEKIYFNFSERLESHSRPFVNQSPRKNCLCSRKSFSLCESFQFSFPLCLALGLWD